MSAIPSATVDPASDPSRKWKHAKASYWIRRVAVLGAGTMGARIAAHIANAGFPVLLLDLSQPGDANRLATQALEALKKSKPAALADPATAARIAPGNFSSDLPRLADCDWVIEAVSERMEIKQKLLAGAAPHLGERTIFTTNTSGLPIAELGRALPEMLRSRWFGTHFFNPPRYMRLMEIIPTGISDPDAVASVARFADLYLGKEVVAAKDSPNFIANRIGVFTLLNAFRAMRAWNLTIEEVDALTGVPLGWPKTATFRLADMVGIDVLANVAQNFLRQGAGRKLAASKAELPTVLEEMVRRNRLGDKTGQGFYRKEPQPDGSERRLVLDPDTMEYREWRKPAIPAVEVAKKIESLPERIRTLLAADPEKDKAAAFYWTILPDLWTYTADRVGEISDSIADIDRAICAGFHWELGPFAMWDAAGLSETVKRMQARGQAIPAIALDLLNAGFQSWYRGRGSEQFAPSPPRYLPVETQPGTELLRSAKRAGGEVSRTPDVSLIDIGDGAAAIEFHAKMNTLGEETVTFLRRVLSPESEAVNSYQAFIVANDGGNFSAGANLMQLLLAAQDEEWEEIDRYIRAFQAMTQAVKFCPRPVVAAPFALSLGGGAEICLHSAACRAHFELYTGLVEAGVGLLPAGGGLKEMLLRCLEAAEGVDPQSRSGSVEINDAIHRAFRTIATAKVSSSAVEAGTMGLLRRKDGISMNRARLAHDAKALALHLASTGYVPPLPNRAIPAPGGSLLATLRIGIHTMKEAARITDHDALVAGKIANVLAGGGATAGSLLEEQNLLDLEREAFLSLCGEPKTQARIAHTLKTGKPLRN